MDLLSSLFDRMFLDALSALEFTVVHLPDCKVLHSYKEYQKSDILSQRFENKLYLLVKDYRELKLAHQMER